MSDTPPRQFPSLSEDSVVRAKLKISTLVAIIGAAFTSLIGFATVVIFSYVMWSDVQTLKESQRKTAEAFEAQAAALQVIKDSVKEIEWRQKYGHTASQPSTTPRNTP